MNINIPCHKGSDICLLSYSLEHLAWECTTCSQLFTLPDGGISIDDGRHVDWHADANHDGARVSYLAPGGSA